MTQGACFPDIPRPSARLGYASHQPTSHLPPSHNAPFGTASVYSNDLPTKDYRMFKQVLGYLTIFKWPFNPMVDVWARTELTVIWGQPISRYHGADETYERHQHSKQNQPPYLICFFDLVKEDYQFAIALWTRQQTPIPPLSLISSVSMSNGRTDDVCEQNACRL